MVQVGSYTGPECLSDADDLEMNCNSPLMPLPPVPPNQGPPAISLGYLLDFAVQKTYHELVVLSELLPKKSDVERKISIVQFAHSTRQLFIRLLAAVRWAKTAGKVDVCMAISCFLNQQSMIFVDTADKLSVLSREIVVNARLPVFQIPVAVDVLTLGTYPRLPICIQTRFIPEKAIQPKEETAVLRRLNQVIHYKILGSALPLPKRMHRVTVTNGMAIFTVPGEFEASLTLLGELPVTPWTLVSLKILVADVKIGEGQPLVHSLQGEYLQNVAQARLNSSNRPLDDLYSVLHAFALLLQLDVFYCQMCQLVQDRRTDSLSIDEYVIGQRLVISYWKQMGSASSGESGSKSATKCCLVLYVSREKPSLPLQMKHLPELETDVMDEGKTDSLQLPKLSGQLEEISIESLLSATINIRIENKLRRVKSKLENLLNKTCGGDQSGFDCVLFVDVKMTAQYKMAVEEDSGRESNVSEIIPFLGLKLLDNSEFHEYLIITINVFSGQFLCHSPALSGGKCQLLVELEKRLNSRQFNSLVESLASVKTLLAMERCRKRIAHMPIKVIKQLPLLPQSGAMNCLSVNRLYLRFLKFDNYYLVVEFVSTSGLKLDMRYFMLTTAAASANSGKSIGDIIVGGSMADASSFEFLQPVSLVQIDVNALMLLTSQKGKFSSTRGKLGKRRWTDRDDLVEPPNKMARDGGVFSALAVCLSMCQQRIPFLMLTEELSRRQILFQPLQRDVAPVGMIVRIISVQKAVSGASKELMDKFWPNVVACSWRISTEQKTSGLVWQVEVILANPPMWSTQEPPTDEFHSGERPQSFVVSLTYDFSPLGIGKCVDDLLLTFVCFANLYEPVKRFADVYYNSEELQRAVKVKTYNYHRLILAYGDGFNYTAMLQYRDTKFHLSFGSSHSEIGTNPHSLMQFHLESLFLRTLDVTLIAEMLRETIVPLVALAQLHKATPLLIGVNETTVKDPVSGRAQVQTYSPLVLLPTSPVSVRLIYRGKFVVEFRCLTGGKVMISDRTRHINLLRSGNRSALGGRKCEGIFALQAFFEKFGETVSCGEESGEIDDQDSMPKSVKPPASVETTACLSQNPFKPLSQPCTPSSPLKQPKSEPPGSQQNLSPSGFSINSPPSLVAPSPMNPTSVTSASVSQTGATVAPSPAALATFTPSPAPMSTMSNPMTPSPAGVPPPVSSAMMASSMLTPSPGTLNLPYNTMSPAQMQSSPAPASCQLPIVSPSPSDLSQMIKEIAGEPMDEESNLEDFSGSDGSVIKTECGVTESNTGGSQAAESEEFSDFSAAFPAAMPSNWQPSRRPFLMSHRQFVAAFAAANSDGNGKKESQERMSPLEKFLGCVYLLDDLENRAAVSENVTGLQAVPGCISFIMGGLKFRFMVYPATMTSIRMKVESADSGSETVGSEDRAVLEKYLSLVVVNNRYSDTALICYLKILQHCRLIPMVLKSFINIMRQQMYPEAGHKWHLELVLTVPPSYVCLVGHKMNPGQAAVCLGGDQNQLLFFLKFTSTVSKGTSLTLPLVYDLRTEGPSANTIKLFDVRPDINVTPTQQFVAQILKRQSDYVQHSGDCAIWMAVRELLQNFPSGNSGNT